MFELNAPNVLTLLRISLVPVLAAVLLSALPDADLLAAVVFVVASATDALDGWLARRRSMITAFGKLMDPLAGKLLITAAPLSLVSLHRLAHPGRARLARVALPARRLGGDGHHRARIRRHGPADARDGAGPGHPRELLGQAQDRLPGRDGARADLGRRPVALGRRADLRHGRGHRALRDRLLLRAAAASFLGPPSGGAVEPLAHRDVMR